MTPRKLALLTALATFAGARSAAADVPPDPGFVETCTVPTQEGLGGGPCESVSTFHGEVDVQADQGLRARGMIPRCAGGGATVGFALYCSGPATQAPPEQRHGCSVSVPTRGGVSERMAPLALSASMALASIVRARRTRRRQRNA